MMSSLLYTCSFNAGTCIIGYIDVNIALHPIGILHATCDIDCGMVREKSSEISVSLSIICLSHLCIIIVRHP
jgi:hypothetical protein